MDWKYAHNTQYLALIKKFPLVPISSRKQLAAAVEAIHPLFLKQDLTKAESDYFDILVGLIKDYERKTVPRVYVTPAESLEFLMEMNDLTQTDIAKIAGMQKSHVSEFFGGKRSLPKEAAVKLGARFKVNPVLFLPKIMLMVPKDQIENIDLMQYPIPSTSVLHAVREQAQSKYKHKKVSKTKTGTRSAGKAAKSRKG